RPACAPHKAGQAALITATSVAHHARRSHILAGGLLDILPERRPPGPFTTCPARPPPAARRRSPRARSAPRPARSPAPRRAGQAASHRGTLRAVRGTAA